jgi:hypothetical protein
VHPDAREDEVIASVWRLGARIGAILDEDTGSYDLTVEEDVLLTTEPQYDAARLQTLLTRVVDQADRLEQEYLPGLDQSLGKFREEVKQEIVHGR